jgi:hypothetical protein
MPTTFYVIILDRYKQVAGLNWLMILNSPFYPPLKKTTHYYKNELQHKHGQ